MIPLRDDIPSRRIPIVNYGIIAVNVAVFAYEAQLGRRLLPFIESFGLVPARFHSEGAFVGRFLPVYTSMFLHGGLLHLLGNMWFLYIFGDNVEDRLGHARYLFLYFACGTLAALAQVSLLQHSTLPMVGASGAIAGVTGAYFVFFPRARVVTLVPIFFFWEILQVPAVVFLLFWFVLQIVAGMMSLGGSQAGGVAWWAHVGCFAGGAFGGVLLAPNRRRFRRTGD